MALIAPLALLAGAQTRAEVGMVSPSGGDARGFVMMGRGSADDPFPWPGWSVLDPNRRLAYLDEEGDARGDGPPDADVDPATRLPEVVWALFDGADYEVVLARWTMLGWSEPRRLTQRDGDDLDPAIDFASDGALAVTWWRPVTPDGPATVWYLHEPASGGVGPPDPGSIEQVGPLAGDALHPDVAHFAGTAFIAFQDGDQGGAVTIEVARREDGGSWRIEPIGSSAWPGDPPGGSAVPDVAVRIHASGDHLWADWMADTGVMHFSEYRPATGDWSAPEAIPLAGRPDDAPEIRRALTRVSIRRRVTAD